MNRISRRSLLRASVGVAAVGTLARPHIANAAAKTATVWWTQGFIPSEDAAFRQLVADYEKTSGNTLNYSIVPFAPLRQKEISAVTSGVVPDVMEDADFSFTPLNAWQDKLEDVSDVVETQKSHFSDIALLSRNNYNNVTKKRSFYGVPMKSAAVMFHIWKSLVEKGGLKVSDIPNQWDPFIDFFKPIQAKLREQGMRHTYVYGWEVSTIGVDPINTFNAFMIAYGGKDLVTPDGKLHADNPQVKEAVIKALTKLTTDYKDGYVPPGVVNWNDADDNNAFHSKLCVMDFDGSLSTELALLHNKAEYDDILTHAIPNGNDGKPLPAQVGIFGAVIPKGAKNVDVAKEFLKYAIEPKVLNEYLKGGLGRWAIPMPDIAKSDPFWLHSGDPHRTTYIEETLFGPTIPLYEAYSPAAAQVNAEHVFQVGWADIVNNGMKPEAAADKAFKRAEAIFAKYPIQQA
ncbi:MAG TPA: ABC transporter substrate-binding protein [Stellaceae bacterium]|nr:ABC transporter substrate-binding protein [Stellaceae bacterium]